jgi:CubicO group peptidase (beta-lactamase class C family)
LWSNVQPLTFIVWLTGLFILPFTLKLSSFMKQPSSLLSLITALLLTAAIACKKDTNSPPAQPTPPPPAGPATQQDIPAVDNLVSSFMTTYNIPGASLAVTRNGKLVYKKGYGVADQTTNEKTTPDHRFRLASVSKTYTGVAIMKLVQEGKLTLDAKVFGTNAILGTEYGTTPYNSNLANITVRHLLHNTSGSWGAQTGGDVIDHNPSFNNQQLFNWVLNTRPNPQVPGAVYDYSNVGFWIAGRVIEKVSGKTFVNYVKEELMTPIGVSLTDIAGRTLADRKPNEVRYHGQGTDANFVYSIAFPRRDADGGLISTAPDLARFVCAIDGFATRPDLLNAASLTALGTGSTPFPSYGLGIGIWSAENLLFNYGSLPGTRTGFMRHNNGTNAVLLLNSRVPAPSSGPDPFVQAMQTVLLNLVKSTAYPWQDIDQF